MVYERLDPESDLLCMISFQKESRPNTNYWLLGDSFLRAFYTIYDGEGQRIGLVGDTVLLEKSEIIQDEDAEKGIWDNPLIYFLLAALALLCILAICLSVVFSYRLRKRNKNSNADADQ